ncbi:hypothetical protein JOC85_000984 [Bacillus mesophilus]|uniref:Uncharacterized protein n=1 Tax=Bacillus mesophilus TaxID=1808955 RepID=A0A6M0Q3G4_9BACI|nr:hypothetical protein [Bacillus mesophilus]MBM7660217.1 hypothetical protein [Bacillus mesophilus]NEY70935.1 hypothetical protein [Bacillus mesophilus]
MDRNKRFRTFIVLALVISVMINVSLLNKIGQLENNIYNISQQQQHLISSVDNQNNNVQHALNEFIKEQSWISSFTMEVNEAELDTKQAEATIQWQVKELHNDSKVVFNYAYGNSEEYKEVTAEEVQKGLFQAKVPFEVELEPQWEVVIMSSDNGSTATSMEEEAKKMDGYNEHALKYFVSVTYDDVVKSSDIYTEHLGHYGTNFYGMLQTDVHFYDDQVNINLFNHNVNKSSVLLEEVYLLKYENDKLIGEEKLSLDQKNPDEMVQFFQLNKLEQYEDMRLVLKVIYSNGETFEKEVY